jgi:tellurite resistance protein TerA
VDNGDGDDDNDDLDLRVGILLPNGQMRFIQAPDTPGSFDSMPFVRHLGDVAGASGKEPATETVEVNPALARYYGGTVGLVFSVYSALANGAVSVASMRPKMVMQYGEQVVECDFDFRLSKAAGTMTRSTPM